MINVFQLFKMMNGRNPQQVLMQVAQQNPIMNQALQMTNGQTPQQMRQTAMNLARQHGVDINQLAQMMGINGPL